LSTYKKKLSVILAISILYRKYNLQNDVCLLKKSCCTHFIPLIYSSVILLLTCCRCNVFESANVLYCQIYPPLLRFSHAANAMYLTPLRASPTERPKWTRWTVRFGSFGWSSGRADGAPRLRFRLGRALCPTRQIWVAAPYSRYLLLNSL
jgi:hypothetical protein